MAPLRQYRFLFIVGFHPLMSPEHCWMNVSYVIRPHHAFILLPAMIGLSFSLLDDAEAEKTKGPLL